MNIFRRKPCEHEVTEVRCITCDRRAKDHKISCLCQDFRRVCARCKALQ